MAGGGERGSRTEPRCDPAPPLCQRDVERMLLDAQMEPDGNDGALPSRIPPSRDSGGSADVTERLRPQPPPGRDEAPRNRPDPAEPRDAPQDNERNERRPGTALRHSEQRCAKDPVPFPCRPPPVRWALRDGAVLRRKGPFSSELLLLVIPPLLLSHVLTLGLGIYIGKRLAAASANPL